jgi:hypothetical protein
MPPAITINFPPTVFILGPQVFINQDTPPPLMYPSGIFVFIPPNFFTVP